jgi:hypothetical protein
MGWRINPLVVLDGHALDICASAEFAVRPVGVKLRRKGYIAQSENRQVLQFKQFLESAICVAGDDCWRSGRDAYLALFFHLGNAFPA